MLTIAQLGIWLQIIQSFSFLLCHRSLPLVFIMLSHDKVVEKAIRMFPQFRNVASLSESHKETSWLYNTFDF